MWQEITLSIAWPQCPRPTVIQFGNNLKERYYTAILPIVMKILLLTHKKNFFYIFIFEKLLLIHQVEKNLHGKYIGLLEI